MTSSKSWQPSSSSKYHHHNHSIFNVCLVIFKSNQISLLFSFFSLFLFSGKNHLPKRKKCFHFLFHTGQVRTNNIFFHLKRSISFIFYVWRQILCPKYPGSLCVLSELYLLQTKYFSFQTSTTYRSIDLFIENKNLNIIGSFYIEEIETNWIHTFNYEPIWPIWLLQKKSY